MPLGRWSAPGAASARSLTDARQLDAGLSRLFAQANDPTSELIATLSAFARPGDPADRVAGARRRRAGVGRRRRARAIAAHPGRRAQAVALLLVGAAVALLLRRRHHELRLLAAQGASPAETGAGTALEVLPATVVGAVAGWLLSAPIVRMLGPSPDVDPAQVAPARGAVLIVDRVVRLADGRVVG